MKQLIALFKSGLLLYIAGFITICSAQTETAADTASYNSQILTKNAGEYLKSVHEKLLPQRKAVYEYLQSVTKSRRTRVVERKRQEMIIAIKKNSEYFKTFIPFNNDNEFKDELQHYLDFEYSILKEDFDKIVDMEQIEALTIDQEEAHQMALDLAFEKLDTCFEQFERAEDAFFARYNIKKSTEKDKMSLAIERANDLIEYYNSIHRIFYKVDKIHRQAHEAVQRKDVVALEQLSVTIVSFADEALEKLSNKQPFEGDNELITATKDLVGFYKKEGLGRIPLNVKFNLDKDRFDEAAKKIQSIKSADRTEADVKEYNSAVNDYNKAVKEINKVNSSSTKTHNQMIKRWNDTGEMFFKKHS